MIKPQEALHNHARAAQLKEQATFAGNEQMRCLATMAGETLAMTKLHAEQCLRFVENVKETDTIVYGHSIRMAGAEARLAYRWARHYATIQEVIGGR